MRFGMLVGALAALWVQPAVAASSNVFLTGKLTKQTSIGAAENFGVGDTLTLSGSFDPAAAVAWGDTGYKVVGFYGNSSFKVTLADREWHAADDILDGFPILFDDSFTSPYTAAPAVVFKDGKVAGVMGFFAPTGNAPILHAGSSGQGAISECGAGPAYCPSFSLNLSDTFTLSNDLLYQNSYGGPTFEGVWNFAASSAPMPEPATWVLMIMGIGMAGAAMRRHPEPAPRLSALPY